MQGISINPQGRDNRAQLADLDLAGHSRPVETRLPNSIGSLTRLQSDIDISSLIRSAKDMFTKLDRDEVSPEDLQKSQKLVDNILKLDNYNATPEFQQLIEKHDSIIAAKWEAVLNDSVLGKSHNERYEKGKEFKLLDVEAIAEQPVAVKRPASNKKDKGAGGLDRGSSDSTASDARPEGALSGRPASPRTVTSDLGRSPASPTGGAGSSSGEGVAETRVKEKVSVADLRSKDQLEKARNDIDQIFKEIRSNVKELITSLEGLEPIKSDEVFFNFMDTNIDKFKSLKNSEVRLISLKRKVLERVREREGETFDAGPEKQSIEEFIKMVNDVIQPLNKKLNEMGRTFCNETISHHSDRDGVLKNIKVGSKFSIDDLKKEEAIRGSGFIDKYIGFWQLKQKQPNTEIQNVRGDGNCFLYAFFDQLFQKDQEQIHAFFQAFNLQAVINKENFRMDYLNNPANKQELDAVTKAIRQAIVDQINKEMSEVAVDDRAGESSSLDITSFCDSNEQAKWVDFDELHIISFCKLANIGCGVMDLITIPNGTDFSDYYRTYSENSENQFEFVRFGGLHFMSLTTN